MWKRKDLVTMAVAAIGTFGLTLGTFLPRVVNATADSASAKVLSPVLKIGGCEIQAQTEGSAMATSFNNNGNSITPQGQVMVSAGLAPVITFIVKNTTDAEASISFNAAMQSAQPGGRSMSAPRPQWSESFDLVMAPGETREIAVDTRIALAAGRVSSLLLRDNASTQGIALNNGSTIRVNGAVSIAALTFNVLRTGQQAATSFNGNTVATGTLVLNGNVVSGQLNEGTLRLQNNEQVVAVSEQWTR